MSIGEEPQACINIVNHSLTKEQRQCNGAKIAFVFFFLAVPHSSWDLIDNSLTRDGTWTKAMKALSPNC